MITLFGVTDTPLIEGQPRPLALNVSLSVPPGRYVLLAQNPRLRRPAIDILTGLRPPTSGSVFRSGACSWPIGRTSLLRGNLNGHQVIDLIARLYLLDREMCYWIVEQFLTDPDCLAKSIRKWPIQLRLEFQHVLSLIPQFDVYVVDGQLPFRKDRFTDIWRALFSRRIEGRTLILSAVRASDALEFCDAALVLHHGQIHIETGIERLLDEFPVRAFPVERTDSAESIGDAVADDDF